MKITKNNLDKVFFTSDTHFSHENIRRYDERPYNSIEEMDKALISNWNNKVKKTDTIFHLGDVMWNLPTEKGNKILSQLNGHIILIKGNHDQHIDSFSQYFQEITSYKELKVEIDEGLNKDICLFHFPIRNWNKKHYSSYHLYGHIHSNMDVFSDELSWDVGVRNNNYSPVSLNDILKILKHKSNVISNNKRNI